jgi:choline kinase
VNQPFRVVILAAGRGSRMRGETADRPKCFVSLAGRSLLDWQKSAFRASGAHSIAAVGGYKAHLLAEQIDVPFVNESWASSNMVSSLCSAEPWLSEGDTLVSYSDIVFGPSAVAVLANAPGDIVITYDRLWSALWSARFENPLDDAETFRVDQQGRILEIGGRPSSMVEVEAQFMGLFKFSKSGWRKTRNFLDELDPTTKDKLDMTSLLAGLIAAGVPVHGVPVDGGWVEVDSEADLACYEAKMASVNAGVTWSHDWR